MNFIKYDANTGAIIASGDMPEDSIDHLNTLGQNLMKTYDTSYNVKEYKVDLDTMTVIPVDISGVTEPPFLALKNTIKMELQRTDYTQAVDAGDHLTTEMITAYRQYRVILRSALDQPDFNSMVLALPTLDPTGYDAFAMFRTQLIPPPPDGNANITSGIVTS
jgi:hypothetical protein